MKLYLEDRVKKYFSPTKPYFDQIMMLSGERFRQQEGRLTQRVYLGETTYFVKQHFGIGWREIFKNLTQLRWPVLSASNEWFAIKKLQKIGIQTPTLAAFGQRGINPGALKSFILTEELTHTISLELFCKDWKKTKPNFNFKKLLIQKIAEISKKMHTNGINHRDFYICHFLLKTSSVLNDDLQLYLIDLHRAQIRKKTPLRWIIKDLAGLYFSSKDTGLTKRDLYRFIKTYSGTSLRFALNTQFSFWQNIKKRGDKLYAAHA